MRVPLLALLVALAPLAAAQSADVERSVVVGGVKRTYLLHLPAGRASASGLPLVVVYHGGGGNGRNAARMSGMDAKADRAGFVVAYPNGTGPALANALLTWNAWLCCGTALDRRADDVGFTRAMVEAIARDQGIDRRRVYATGMSNGAMMAYRVACEAADVFAAIAPVAGAQDTDDCRPSAPVSVIAFHGTADHHVKYDGGAPDVSLDRHPRADKSVATTIAFWAWRDRCATPPARSRNGHVLHETYTCESPRTGVELYAIDGQGHAWPGGTAGLRAGNVDLPTSEISATDLMWDFFARHPKP